MNREEYGKFFGFRNAIVLAPFVEGRGNRVHDFTRNRLDFTLYGGYKWNRLLNPGLWFDGWTGYGLTSYKEILEQKSFSIVFRTIWEGYTNIAKESASSAILGDIGTVTTDPDTGKTVISVTTLDGAGYCIVARFQGWKIRGACLTYDCSRILTKPTTPVLTHRIEIWDETTGELILQADYDSDDYPDTLTYRSWQKSKEYLFAEPDHTYLFKVYYYGNVDMYFEYVIIDMIHRTPICKIRPYTWRYYVVRTGTFICYYPDGTYDLCKGAGLLPFKDEILTIVLDYDSWEIRIYKDGILSATKSLSQRDLRSGGSLKIGGFANHAKNHFYNGALGFVGYYSKAFSDREAKLIAKQVKQGARPLYITHRGVFSRVKNTGIEVDGNMTNVAEVMC